MSGHHDIATAKIFLMSHHDNMLHQCIEVSWQRTYVHSVCIMQ